MFENLSVEQLQLYADTALPVATNILIGIAILIFGKIASGWAAKAVVRASKPKLDDAIAKFLSQIVKYLVLAAAVIAALGRVGVETTSFIAILGSAGLAVGLALQGSLSNFAAGVMILFFRPFEIGHVVSAGGHTAEIVDIGLFATTMHTLDRQKIIVPNSAITGGSIVNHTALGVRGVAIAVGVAYGTDLNKMKSVLNAAAAKVPGVLSENGFDIVFTNMAASAIEFDFKYQCDAADYVGTQGAVREALYTAMIDNDIDIPFDQVVMHNAS